MTYLLKFSFFTPGYNASFCKESLHTFPGPFLSVKVTPARHRLILALRKGPVMTLV